MKLAVAIDFTIESSAALRWALDLRDHLRESQRPVELVAISIAPRTWFSMDREQKTTDDPGLHHSLVFQVREFLESVDSHLEDIRIIVDEGRPAPLISSICAQEEVDLLAIGRTAPTALNLWSWGSTSHKIADQIDCPLAIVDPDHQRFRRDSTILVGVDFSLTSENALWNAAELADLSTSELHVLHALEDMPLTTMSTGMVNYLSPGDLAHLSANARESLEHIMIGIRRRHPKLAYATLVHSGNAIKLLTHHVRNTEADLLVLGKIHRSRSAEYLLGGVARGLVKRPPTTLLLIPS